MLHNDKMIVTKKNNKMNKTKAEAVQDKGWISVEDELPQDGQNVIVIHDGNLITNAATYNKERNEFGRYSNYIPGDRCGAYTFPRVTHWHSFPLHPNQQLK